MGYERPSDGIIVARGNWPGYKTSQVLARVCGTFRHYDAPKVRCTKRMRSNESAMYQSVRTNVDGTTFVTTNRVVMSEAVETIPTTRDGQKSSRVVMSEGRQGVLSKNLNLHEGHAFKR